MEHCRGARRQIGRWADPKRETASQKHRSAGRRNWAQRAHRCEEKAKNSGAHSCGADWGHDTENGVTGMTGGGGGQCSACGTKTRVIQSLGEPFPNRMRGSFERSASAMAEGWQANPGAERELKAQKRWRTESYVASALLEELLRKSQRPQLTTSPRYGGSCEGNGAPQRPPRATMPQTRQILGD